MLSDKGYSRRDAAPVAPKNDTTPIKRTSAHLRDILFQEIASLRKGDSEPDQASAVARLAQQIINSARLDLDYAEYKQKSGDSANGANPILLGNSTDKDAP